MRQTRYTVSVPSILIACLVLAAAGCGGGSGSPEGQDTARITTGETAPEFTLNDLDGNPVSMADFAGQVRLVDFWATWCPPCREEVPMYKELHAEYGDRGVRIISISMDGEENLEEVKQFVARYEIPYINLMDDDEVSDRYQAAGLPATYLIDQEGKIVKNFVGAKPKSVLVDLIEGLLASGSGEAGE